MTATQRLYIRFLWMFIPVTPMYAGHEERCRLFVEAPFRMAHTGASRRRLPAAQEVEIGLLLLDRQGRPGRLAAGGPTGRPIRICPRCRWIA